MPSASSSSSIAKPLLRTSVKVRQQRVEVGDGVAGPPPQPGLRAESRTCCSAIVARIALPAADACGISRWPSGVWNLTLPGPSTRSMKTGKPSSQIASREVIFVRSDSSVSSGRHSSPSGSWPRAMSPSRIRPCRACTGDLACCPAASRSGQRPGQRQRRALRRAERPGQVAEGQALGRPVGHDLHQPQRPSDAADGVAVFAAAGSPLPWGPPLPVGSCSLIRAMSPRCADVNEPDLPLRFGSAERYVRNE